MDKVLEIDFLTDIGKQIEDLVWQYDISYIEAALMMAQRLGIEEENIGSLILGNQYVKSKIQEEAEDLNFLERENRFDM